MLFGKRTGKRVHRQKAALVLAALCALMLLAPSGGDRTFGLLLLSRQEMKGMLGGEMAPICKDCNDCNDKCWSVTECYHYRVPPDCDQYPQWCLHSWICSASCLPNQGQQAKGCDTQLADPPESAGETQCYFNVTPCPMPLDDKFLWATIWHSCDTSSLHLCWGQQHFGWCKPALPYTCYGGIELGDPEAKGQRFDCGCGG